MSSKPLPIEMRWRRLPTRVIRAARPGKRQMLAFTGQPWNASTSAEGPFDFCAAMRTLVEDIAARCPEFRHLHVPRILIGVTQARHNSTHGLQARVTPLRFPTGKLTRERRGFTYHIQRYFENDVEFLYVMTFCLPRYLDQSFDQKMVTLFHELYHIDGSFNGDLRRHDGRYQFHTHSQKEYDHGMADHARDYLMTRPDPNLSGFLRLTFAQLQERHGAVRGIVVPRPRIIPLVGAYASAANVT